MYRDDVCAVCGESLPPDHFYCRDHAATVDDRMHEIGELLPRVTADAERLATLLSHVAEATWDYLAEQQPDDPLWPPIPELLVRADADEVDVDVDSEPGYVQARLRLPLAKLLEAVANSLSNAEMQRVATTSAACEGANATH